ncbi:unnamed protein product [Rangifer tarandus platyrhynchus]|uniref:Uncharacterized protein n=2 Tax=Rangifer tarandus platyrhynchus TaxID=3082113 RepID=A0ACB0F1E9_RANTA|nr:unnamed protein product [Rangifer tarandus platyrhynchus]CAI9706785.1 unnamed protein product [Rangifer tarandus platyrhynchus]
MGRLPRPRLRLRPTARARRKQAASQRGRRGNRRGQGAGPPLIGGRRWEAIAGPVALGPRLNNSSCVVCARVRNTRARACVCFHRGHPPPPRPAPPRSPALSLSGCSADASPGLALQTRRWLRTQRGAPTAFPSRARADSGAGSR